MKELVYLLTVRGSSMEGFRCQWLQSVYSAAIAVHCHDLLISTTVFNVIFHE